MPTSSLHQEDGVGPPEKIELLDVFGERNYCRRLCNGSCYAPILYRTEQNQGSVDALSLERDAAAGIPKSAQWLRSAV